MNVDVKFIGIMAKGVGRGTCGREVVATGGSCGGRAVALGGVHVRVHGERCVSQDYWHMRGGVNVTFGRRDVSVGCSSGDAGRRQSGMSTIATKRRRKTSPPPQKKKEKTGTIVPET